MVVGYGEEDLLCEVVGAWGLCDDAAVCRGNAARIS